MFSLWPCSLSLFNSLLYVSMYECREGWERKRDGLVHFSWIWDNEDGERKIRNDKGEMTNSREGRAVIRLQYDFSLNDKALGWEAIVSDCTTAEYGLSFFLFFFLHLSDYAAATVDLELDLTPLWESAYPRQSLMSRFLSAVESYPATGASRNDYFHCLIIPSGVRSKNIRKMSNSVSQSLRWHSCSVYNPKIFTF